MYIEFHLLQNFAPSNLNRDDTNTPKDCIFGGVRRARISSQCIKRSIREAAVFREMTGVDHGVRTKWVSRLIQQGLMEAGKPVEEATQLANDFSVQFAKKVEKPKGSDLNRSLVLIYFSQEEIRMVVEGLLSGIEMSKLAEELVKNIKGRTSAPDIALFGRMLANDPRLNLDAACQVAHAISTHRVDMEMDFYTAVDELLRDDEAGAGMMGTTQFDSACFYRYVRLNWDLLVSNLNGDIALARRTVEAFMSALITAVPSGKQNSFAAYNPPSFIMAVVRADDGWSMANAFEKPVVPGRDGGIVTKSVEALTAYWDRLYQIYNCPDLHPVVLAVDPDLKLNGLQTSAVENIPGWIKAVVQYLPES